MCVYTLSIARVAQWTAHQTSNLGVRGSSPRVGHETLERPPSSWLSLLRHLCLRPPYDPVSSTIGLSRSRARPSNALPCAAACVVRVRVRVCEFGIKDNARNPPSRRSRRPRLPSRDPKPSPLLSGQLNFLGKKWAPSLANPKGHLAYTTRVTLHP